jgi:hypothetical protein
LSVILLNVVVPNNYLKNLAQANKERVTIKIFLKCDLIKNAISDLQNKNCAIAKTSWQQRQDIEHDDTQHNDTQHTDTKHIDTKHDDTQHDDTQHNDT